MTPIDIENSSMKILPQLEFGSLMGRDEQLLIFNTDMYNNMDGPLSVNN